MTPSTSTSRQRSSIEELYTQSQYFTKQLPFQYFSDSLSEYVTILNSNRQIVFCNRPLVSYLHAVDANEVIGKRPGEALQCEHARNSTGGCGTTEFCRMCGANKAIQKSQQGIEEVQECRINTEHAGGALDLTVHATPLVYQDQQFTIFAMTDSADEKRRKVLESLFFHDILNTVGGLMGFSELLKDASPEEVKEFVPMISRLSSELNDQIAAQRELLKAEQHEMTITPETIHARSLLDTAITSVCKHSVAAGKEILIAPDAEDFLFISDGRLLRRVVTNLIKNALEASSPGSAVTVDCKRKDGSVQISVQNNGVIPREIQLQIFQRSFSTKGAGRGLGTYSVKMFTEQYLQGRVSFVSNADDGTKFTVTIPCSVGPAPSDNEVLAAPAAFDLLL